MNQKGNVYLYDDEELLDEIEIVGPQPTDMEERKRRINIIQIKAILRSRKTMVELDHSNKKYSIVILFFAAVQIVIAGFQLILQINNFPDKVFTIFVTIAFIVIVYWLAKEMSKMMLNS